MLHASGFPVTTIGRWWFKYEPSLSSAERRFWDRVYARPVRRHRQRPNIEPWPGRSEVAVMAATALRANGVVTIAIDAPPLASDRARAVEVPFLNRRGGRSQGSWPAPGHRPPLLMAFQYRAADYRHQVLEISAPVPVEGETATVFGRCAGEVSAAIRRSPADWLFWADRIPPAGDLADLGLISPKRDRSPAARPVSPSDGGFLHDGSTDSVPAQG